MLVPAKVVSAWLCVCDDWAVSAPVDTTHFCRGLDWSLTKRLLGKLDKDLVKVCIVDAVQANESSEDVRGEVLQDIKLVTC